MGRRKAEKEDLGLGERLVIARKWRGLTQAGAAAEIGVSRKTISRIETGYYMAHANTRARVLAWIETQEAAAAQPSAAEAAPAERPGGAGTRAPTAAARVARNGLPVAVQMAVRRKLEKAERRNAAARKRRRRGAGSGVA